MKKSVPRGTGSCIANCASMLAPIATQTPMLDPVHPSPRKEIVGIDIIRFLCAFSVMLAHYLSPLSGQYPWAQYGGAGVDIFFIISGFIIPQSSEGRSPFAFVQSRVVRLVPGAWICATLTLFAVLLLGVFSGAEWGKYFRSIFFIPAIPGHVNNLGDIWIDGVYWTLFVEIAFYSLIMLLLLGNAFRYIGLLASALGIISLVYWTALLGAHFFFPTAAFSQTLLDTGFKRYFDLTLVHHGAWFGLGINLWLLTKTRLARRLPSMLICLAGGLLQETHHALFALYANPVPGLVYDLVGIGLILLAVFSPLGAGYSERTRKACRWLGLATYPLYLIHDRAGTLLIATLAGAAILSREGATFLVMLIAILVAFIIARFFEPGFQGVFRRAFEKIKHRLQRYPRHTFVLEKTSPHVVDA